MLISDIFQSYFEKFQFTYKQHEDFADAFRSIGYFDQKTEAPYPTLYGIQSLLKDKGMKHLWVLEVATEGLEEKWGEQPMTERISIRKNEVLME